MRRESRYIFVNDIGVWSDGRRGDSYLSFVNARILDHQAEELSATGLSSAGVISVRKLQLDEV